jgi:hypothetical protein
MTILVNIWKKNEANMTNMMAQPEGIGDIFI